MNSTEKPWVVQQERRVLTRGRATADLDKAGAKEKPEPKSRPAAPPVDHLNQD